MNKKKYGIMIGVMGIIIVLLIVVLFVLIKQKRNTVGSDTKKIAESVVPEELREICKVKSLASLWYLQHFS